jgi:hypothetical protein
MTPMPEKPTSMKADKNTPKPKPKGRRALPKIPSDDD